MNQSQNLSDQQKTLLKSVGLVLSDIQKLLAINKGQLSVFLYSEWEPLQAVGPLLKDLHERSSEALTLVRDGHLMVEKLESSLGAKDGN